jgi:hypothetical protein
MGSEHSILWMSNSETMILTGNGDSTFLEVNDRLIGSPMPVSHFVGL